MPHPGHAGDERPIDLARRARPEGFRQCRGRKARLRHQKATRGVLVETMHEAGALAVAAAKRFEHAVHMAHRAGAALHREPHGLVEDEHVVILVERDPFKEFSRLLGLARALARRCRRGERERRHAHLLPGLEPVLGLDATAVDPQFALTHDALNMAEGEARDDALRESDRRASLIRPRSRSSFARRACASLRRWGGAAAALARELSPPASFASCSGRPRAAPGTARARRAGARPAPAGARLAHDPSAGSSHASDPKETCRARKARWPIETGAAKSMRSSSAFSSDVRG